MPQAFSAYHGVTASEHQTQFDKLSKTGYRIISLSVYGSSSNPRYAAVWVLRGGPAYQATHGISADAYQTFFNTWTAKGYIPTLISATGSGSGAVFAAVFEKLDYNAMVARHNISQTDFDNENNNAKKNGMILKTCTVYGSAGSRLYAGVWIPNPNFIKWNIYSGTAAADYQAQFDATTQLPFYKPVIVSLSENQVYCSLFTDSIFGNWQASHGLTSAQYQTEFDKFTKQGLMPIYVDGGGSGDDTRYAAVFAETDIPMAKTWHVQGTGIAATSGLDAIMKTFMQKHAVRYAQLCLGRNGTIKYNKAFTWAESPYKIGDTTNRFMLASCSKLYLTSTVQAVFNHSPALLAPSDKAYAKLGYSGPKDSRSNDITIQNLLDHKGGFDADSYDATYSMRQISIDQGLGHACSKNDVATYMYKKRNLSDNPGAIYKYSNYGYVLLSLIIEKVTGQDYFQYLKANVLIPSNVTEVKLWPTVANPRASDEVVTESSGLGQSAVFVNSALQVPQVYGGDGMIKEVAAASCGIASSAHAMVQMIHSHAVWGTGGRAAGSARSGSTPGSSTLAVSNGDNMDWAYTINTREFVDPDSKPLDKLGNDITQFLSDHKASI